MKQQPTWMQRLLTSVAGTTHVRCAACNEHRMHHRNAPEPFASQAKAEGDYQLQ